MVQEFKPHSWGWSNGFFPDQPDFGPGMIPDTAKDGSGVWIYGEDPVSDRGHLSMGNSGGVSDLAVIGGQHGGVIGVGNIWRAFATTWIVGTAILNGGSIGSSPGVLSLLAPGLVAAGLDTPGKPGFAPTATSGRLNGSMAVTVQAYRQTSGARSSRSPISDPISVQNKLGRVTFPAQVSGMTHWIIGGSVRGVPGGPSYRLTNVAIVPAGTASVDIDFVNGDLGALMAINYDKPPACTHCAAIGGTMMALGTGSGGYGVRPSIVGQPEAFPLEYGFDLPVRESITGVQPGVDGIVLISTANGLMGLLLSGSSSAPILPRVVMGSVGFARANAFWPVYDQIYGYGTQGGPCRTHGGEEPDTTFARPVQQYMLRNGFNSNNTVGCLDQAHGAVIYAAGNKALPLMLSTNKWSTPIPLPGTVSAAVALNGRAHLQVGSTVYSLDTANGGSSWFLRSVYSDMGMGLEVKNTSEFYGAGTAGITFDLQVPNADWQTPVSIGGLFPYTVAAPFGALGSRVIKPNRQFRALCLRASGTTGDQTPLAAILKGYAKGIAA
jgi:hypothetical protein